MNTSRTVRNAKLVPVISGLKRFILWDYRRASWQYDVMVALILIFLFATPRELFRDQPKVPHVAEISSKPDASAPNPKRIRTLRRQKAALTR